jgi:hypothetical protein
MFFCSRVCSLNLVHLVLIGILAAPRVGAAPATSLDAHAIGAAASREATVASDGVVRLAWTRDDVQVRPNHGLRP